MLYYINSPGYQIIKLIKVFPNPEIERYIAKKTCFPHIFTEQNYRDFFMISRYIAKKRHFF